MIPNVTRDGNAIGLVSYLADDNPRPDRKRFRYNVHVKPHLVAGDKA